MTEKKLDEITKQLIYKQKLRCNMCYEIPIIKEINNAGVMSFFISAECLNKHGVYFCTLKDFCSDKNQLDQIKCCICNKSQGKIDYESKLYNYCRECKKFLCSNCIPSHHKKNQNHHTLKVEHLDFNCKEHSSPFVGFCPKCNINICNACLQKTHSNHGQSIVLNNIMPNQQKLKEATDKIGKQKNEIDEINKILDELLKINNKIKEYQENLNSALKFNNQIINSIDPIKPNYQSILNFDKILDIDISDISWVVELQELLDKFIKFIKSNSSSITHEKTPNPTNNIIDKELMDTFKKSIVDSINKPIINPLEIQNAYDFTDNELLKEIGNKNKRIIKKEEIIGELKNIYIMNDCNNYLTVADNGLFLYDQETNDLLSYIDINDDMEYDEIKDLTYYYNNNINKIYLFIGTNTNKIKIYCIDINNEYNNELIQVIKVENIKNIFCNKKGDLFVLENNSTSIYKFNDNKYEQDKEFINDENETKNLYSTDNYLIITIKEKEQIIFYNKDNLEEIFSIDKIKNNEQSKIYELSKNIIYVTFKNIIQVIDVEKKNICYIYDKLNMDYIESGDIINDKDFLLSGNSNNKLTTYILELDEPNKTFKEKKKIEDLQCKLIHKIEKNKLILYTKYGVNIIEI